MNAKRVIALLIIVQLSYFGYSQTIVFPDSIVKIAYEKYKKDSLEFLIKFNSFINCEMEEPDFEKFRDAVNLLDNPSYYKWIKLHSQEIIQKIGNTYQISNIARLISLTNVPDSIRDVLLSGNDVLSKARLGNSSAIDYYINKYIFERDQSDEKWTERMMTHYASMLLHFDSKRAWEMIFRDMESTRIIKQCEFPHLQTENCIILYRTYALAILNALSDKHVDQVIFYNPHIYSYVLTVKRPNEINPYIPEYFKLVENFVKQEYGFDIKIKVPYLRAALW
jgi:hypothetical protein